MANTGERVKWSNLERVELPDIDAVSTEQQANLARVQGALFDNRGDTDGIPRGGLLSRLNYNGTNPAIVTFGFMAITYVAEGAAVADPGPGQVFNYDRSLAHQATYSTASLNISGVGANRPFVWARRVEMDTDEATRRFWDEITKLEYTDTVFTRVRDVVELALSPVGLDNNPPSVGTWVRIARVVSVGSEVVLSPRHDFDGHDATYEADATSRINGGGVRFYAEEPAVDTTRHPTLPELARYVLATLCKIHDGRRALDVNGHLANASVANLRTWRHGWLDTTFRGLKQLQDEIDEEILPRPLDVWAARVFYDSGSFTITSERGIVAGSVVASAFGGFYKATITLPAIPVGWRIFGAFVAPELSLGFGAITASVQVPVVATTETPFDGNGSTDFTIEVALFLKAITDADDWVVVNNDFRIHVVGARL